MIIREAVPSTRFPTCEFCGLRIDVSGGVWYARAPAGPPEVCAGTLKVCSECRRTGCPACLYAVEERADDCFLDVYLCHACLRASDS